MKQLIYKMSQIRPRDFCVMLKLGVTFLPARIYKIFHKDVWVVTELSENARDNGYWLFKYIREKKPNQEVYYPIQSRSSDYFKVEKLGNTVEFGGFKHCFLFWAASKYIGTTRYHGFPEERICAGLFEMKITKFKYIFLNHGFARGHSNIVDGKKTRYDLLIAMSELEKEILLNLNFQTEKNVRAIGFCRHDNLWEKENDGKTILIMPTWRRWLDYRHETDTEVIREIKRKYWKSSYYEEYQALLNDPRLLKFLEMHDLQLVFYLHGYAQGYAGSFSSTSERVLIAEKEEYFVQDLLKQAVFLVTDYSSVSCDYVYMKKPMVYFQFDATEFSEKQYAESEYFTYESNGFGPVVYTRDQVIEEIINSYERNFEINKKYLERVQEFFPNFGHDHCEKTFELIKEL